MHTRVNGVACIRELRVVDRGLRETGLEGMRAVFIVLIVCVCVRRGVTGAIAIIRRGGIGITLFLQYQVAQFFIQRIRKNGRCGLRL